MSIRKLLSRADNPSQAMIDNVEEQDFVPDQRTHVQRMDDAYNRSLLMYNDRKATLEERIRKDQEELADVNQVIQSINAGKNALISEDALQEMIDQLNDEQVRGDNNEEA